MCSEVAIPSSRVNVSYANQCESGIHLSFTRQVAIPSSRVNVSYTAEKAVRELLDLKRVAIPSSRVNVSYLYGKGYKPADMSMSQSPQVGSMFPTRQAPLMWLASAYTGRNPLKSGQCFLLVQIRKKAGSLYFTMSQSPQVGSMFPTYDD